MIRLFFIINVESSSILNTFNVLFPSTRSGFLQRCLAFAEARRGEMSSFMPNGGTEALNWRVELGERPIVEGNFQYKKLRIIKAKKTSNCYKSSKVEVE